MNLLAQARADNAFLIADSVNGFGTVATFHPPTGPDVVATGQMIRIAATIDPATGLIVKAEKSHFTAWISGESPEGLGGAMPTDGWTVAFADSTGTTNTYKIEKGKTMPDYTLDRVTFMDLKKVGA